MKTFRRPRHRGQHGSSVHHWQSFLHLETRQKWQTIDIMANKNINQRLCYGLGMLTASVGTLTAQDAGQRPNIIVFLVDDMGWQDTSVPLTQDTTYYNRLFHTPSMERLAHQGIRFTDAYAHSVSSPSRCSLLTGAHATRHRVTNWTLRRGVMTDAEDALLTPPEWNVNGISPTDTIERSFYATMLPELLRQAGYHTIHCGKAHFGAEHTPAADPLILGFDINIAGHAGGGLANYHGERRYGHDAQGRPTSPFAVPGLEAYWDTNTFVTEALTLEALRSLRTHQASAPDQPFFLYMSHYAVHIPIDRDERFYQKYIDRGLDPKEAAYAALVEGMDKSLGDIMDYLEESGQADNTVILFLSDNGGLAGSDHWRTGPIHTYNAPLRSGKGSMYEGGIRIPMLYFDPRDPQAGTSRSTPIQIEDIYPSILDLAGIDHPTTVQHLDGKSFIPLLTHPEDNEPARPLVWHYPHNWGLNGPGINFASAIRFGAWKLVHRYDTGRNELYHLPSDLGEQHDLSARHPEQTKLLARLLTSELRRQDAQRPHFRATGAPCPWPDGSL